MTERDHTTDMSLCDNTLSHHEIHHYVNESRKSFDENDFSFFPKSPFWTKLHTFFRKDETELLQELYASFDFEKYPLDIIESDATTWVSHLRNQPKQWLSVNELLNAFTLDSEEGRSLMILAEALLRIPDKETRDALIREKISSTQWKKNPKKGTSVAPHQSNNLHDESFFVKLASFGLDVSKKLMTLGDGTAFEKFGKLSQKLSNPLTREAMIQAIHYLGDLFIVGETIEEAIKKVTNSASQKPPHSTYSFDMLGEAAVSFEDAEHYFAQYAKAIKAAGEAGHKSISVKLSALHPRYEVLKRASVVPELIQKVLSLAQLAHQKKVMIMIDAEESERLNLSLEIFETVYLHPSLKQYTGLGLAVQAYQRRATAILDFLIDLHQRGGKQIPVRLVKGAYWDREIKITQELGLVDFPVFTRKVYTDVSYLVCAQKLLYTTAQNKNIFKLYFASHNAHTLSAILSMAKAYDISLSDLTLQRLQGMGESLFREIQESDPDVHLEIYAPVGEYKDLLSYLVRRLLENGANSSFMHKISDKAIPIQQLIEDPFHKAKNHHFEPHLNIRSPKNLFKNRQNSRGTDLFDYPTLEGIKQVLENGQPPSVQLLTVPIDLSMMVDKANQAFDIWSTTSVNDRANLVETLANHLENDSIILQLLCHEGKKTIQDAFSEVREAVDFCRYYAVCAKKLMAEPTLLPGPVGELNQLSYVGRGVFVCISPWNFPLAIFLGQIIAALVTGNTVIAKPSNQTPHIASYVIDLVHHYLEKTMPSLRKKDIKNILQFCHAPSEQMSIVLEHPKIAGIVFTGSTETAKIINRTLSEKALTHKTPLIPFIAETGGINAMIVDSSALFEQVVNDIITSAFRSAGQRCSALRILCIEENIAEPFLKLLLNAMKTLCVGVPYKIETDVGPIIDETAKKNIEKQTTDLSKRATLLYQTPLHHLEQEQNTYDYISPQLWKIHSISDVDCEIFGPVLQVVPYKDKNLEKTIKEINDLGYGLTFGLHTRLESTISKVQNLLKAGNFYVNRSMIGAVVESQPFGGEGNSGTGFKAGGPHYLLKFVHERTLTYNTTAAGGNASLMMIGDEI